MRLQNYVRKRIRDLFELSEHDVKSAVMGESGVDIKLSEYARSIFKWAIECKSYARFSIYKYFAQARENSEKEGLSPALIIKGDRQKPLVVLDLEDFLNLIRNNINEKST